MGWARELQKGIFIADVQRTCLLGMLDRLIVLEARDKIRQP